jgi:hypothetical protein
VLLCVDAAAACRLVDTLDADAALLSATGLLVGDAGTVLMGGGDDDVDAGDDDDDDDVAAPPCSTLSFSRRLMARAKS